MFSKTHIAALVVPVFLTVTAAAAWADAGLYDAPIPPNSAFVRMIDASDSSEPVASVNGTEVSIPASGLSPYIVVPAGKQTIAFSGTSAELDLKSTSLSTVVLGAGSGTAPQTFTDAAVTSPARAGLYFYNLSSETVSLTATIKGKSAPIFKDVAPGKAEFREVNAFDVSLAVTKDGQAIKALETPVSLKRKGGVSVIYFGVKQGVPSLIAEENAVQR